MSKRFIVVSFIFLLIGAVAYAEETIIWPSLCDVDSVSGRAASKADVQEGRAVFLLQAEDVSAGFPLDIAIPQYAYHIDSETNERSAVVIIQAEKLDDKSYAGALDIESGRYLAAFLWEFELIGTEAPD